MPLVRLNVEGVQKLAALRYQTWYVRVPADVTSPFAETEGSPAPGNCDAPPVFDCVPRRTMLPATLISPTSGCVAAESWDNKGACCHDGYA